MLEKSLVIVQTIIFRIKDNQPQFLLLKRNKERGGFWNAINGTMELDESIHECQKREVMEETSIENILNWSEELYRFNFNYKGNLMTVIVFSAQVKDDQEIVINEEHVEYKWLYFNDSIKILKFNDDKKSLEICYNYIKNRLII